MKDTLTLQGLTLSHQQRTLVDRVDLTLRAGSIHGLVGGSGSGKSLTCAGILDLLPPGVHRTGATLHLDGHPVQPHQLRGRAVALVLQNPRSAFNPVRSLRQHALETLDARDVHGKPAHDLILDTLHEVGLKEADRVLDSFAFQLSGGMLQRMMIAMAVLCESPFIIADEPTTDLDVVAQARILDLLESIMQKQAPGMLLVTHDMGVVARLADDVAVMSQGKIVEQGDVETLFNAPKHTVTRSLVSAHLALYGMELAS